MDAYRFNFFYMWLPVTYHHAADQLSIPPVDGSGRVFVDLLTCLWGQPHLEGSRGLGL
jgi:hypothetical protein